MPFKGRKKDLASPKKTCLNSPAYLQLCPTPYWFQWLIPEGTIWECPKCSRTYYLDKHLRDTGGDYFTSWIPLKADK